MNSLGIYHLLPGPLRTIAASARGYQLRYWRYGKETDRLVSEAGEREHWGRSEWEQWQEPHVQRLLERAVTHVPYYRELWAQRRSAGDQRSWRELENWPILRKEDLRSNLSSFVADDCDPKRMFSDQTSGTSGTPLKIWQSRTTVTAWYSLMEARVRKWNGVSRREHWAILGGQQVVPGDRRRPPFWVRNVGLRQLYLSANHVSKSNARAYWEEIEDFKPTHLVAYSSAAAALAREFLDLGLTVSSTRVVITNAEPLLPWQRDVIREAFAAEVRETYGMGEAVAGACECRCGRLHGWPDAGIMEVLADSDDKPVGNAEAGRLICTGLLNPDMPLIRYEVGDRCGPIVWSESCDCGRRLPTLSGIEGRTSDFLRTADGRKVFWLNPVFYGLPMVEGQMVQEQIDRVRVTVVPAVGFSRESEAAIRSRLRERLGSVSVDITRVAAIPRGANGKFKPVVCNVTDAVAGLRSPGSSGGP